jgi:DNA-binding MurR/RpiR family transcriptional regulator
VDDARQQLTGIGEIDRALELRYARLSPGQRQAIDRLLADARYGAVVSAPELAEAAGVSESTVTRAAQSLGFSGFPDLQRHLRDRFVAPVEARLVPVADRVPGDVLPAARLMLDDADRIRQMVEDFPEATFEAVIGALLGARRVAIFGERGSHGLATILAIGLRLVLDDARLLDQTAGDLPDQLLGMTPGDVVFAISFRRVDRMTMDVLRAAKKRGVTTIAVTDHRSSGAARIADMGLIVRIGTLRLMPAFAAAASLLTALLEEVAMRRHDAAAERLRDAEDLWEEFRSYTNE